jgi:hypothetical protein
VPETVISAITALVSATSALISFRFSWPPADCDRGAAAAAPTLRERPRGHDG